MKSKWICALFCGTSLASGVVPLAGTAHAQPTAETSGAAEEVIVTARRREESLQKIPITVTAFSGEQLRSQSVATTEDLQQHTPALQITGTTYGPSVPTFTIRSQHQLEPIITQDPSVSIYFADFVAARPHGTNAALWDLESVQVLKGPQGTLFGRNTTGGAILITPKKPSTDGFSGEVAARAGDYQMWGATAVLNVPVGEKFAIRLGGQTDTHDGYSRNVLTGQRLDDQNSYSWRVSALWKPTDRIETVTYYNGFQDISAGVAQKVSATRIGAQQPSLARARALDFHEFESNFQPRFAKTQTSTVSNTTTIDLGAGLTLKNIAGYRHVKTHTSQDTDGSNLSIFESFYKLSAEQYSNELQLLGESADKSLDWIIGGYYFKEEGNDQQDTFLAGLRHSEASATNVSYSAFAQATYRPPFVEGLSFTAGGRFTWDHREITARNATNGVCRILTADVGGVPISPCEKTVSTGFRKPTWTLAIDYQATPDLLLYATTRAGYRSGGFNLRGGLPREFEPFAPETVTDYEVGFKSDWTIYDMPLRANLALYHDEYKHVQRTNGFIDPAVGAFTVVVFNAQKAVIDGAEFDASISPFKGLDLRGYFSYSHAKFRTWFLPNGTDLKNNKFSFAPQTSGGASIRYTLPLPETFGEVSFAADWYAQGSMQMTDINEPTGVAPGYHVWNFRTDWNEIGGKPIDFSIFVKNLLDKEYTVAGNTVFTSVGFSSIFMAPPRTVGVELRYRFGE